MMGRMLALAYRLSIHYLGGWSLQRWLIGCLLATSGLLFLVARSRQSPIAWAGLVLLVLSILAVLVFNRSAQRQMFVRFTAQPELLPPSPQRLDPTDKVLVRATGYFEVEGKVHFFAHILAYWRTFATREHAVMAIVPASNFLWFCSVPDTDVGMWYIFFRPEVIREVCGGELYFGGRSSPALCLTYHRPETVIPKRKAGEETVYLAFDDENTRQCVWGDLIAG